MLSCSRQIYNANKNPPPETPGVDLSRTPRIQDFHSMTAVKDKPKSCNLYTISWLHGHLSSADILGCNSPHKHIQATNPVYSPIFSLFSLYRQAVINMLKQQWKKRGWLVLCQSSKDAGAWIRLKGFIETCPKSSQAHNLSLPLRLIVLYGIKNASQPVETSNNKISNVKALEMCINSAKLHKKNILLGVRYNPFWDSISHIQIL